LYSNLAIGGMELLLGIALTWTIILVPPMLIRWIQGEPIIKSLAIAYSVVSSFWNLAIFVALGSQSRTHGAVWIGAFVTFWVLTRHTKKSRERELRRLRAASGYEDNEQQKTTENKLTSALKRFMSL